MQVINSSMSSVIACLCSCPASASIVKSDAVAPFGGDVSSLVHNPLSCLLPPVTIRAFILLYRISLSESRSCGLPYSGLQRVRSVCERGGAQNGFVCLTACPVVYPPIDLCSISRSLSQFPCLSHSLSRADTHKLTLSLPPSHYPSPSHTLSHTHTTHYSLHLYIFLAPGVYGGGTGQIQATQEIPLKG